MALTTIGRRYTYEFGWNHIHCTVRLGNGRYSKKNQRGRKGCDTDEVGACGFCVVVALGREAPEVLVAAACVVVA